MTKALEHFLPGTELNLHSLKEVIRSIGGGGPTASISSNAGAEQHGPGSTSNMSDASPTPLAVKGSGSQEPSLQTEPEPQVASSVTIEEIDELHGELGWLRVDSKGTYRELIPHRVRITALPPLPILGCYATEDHVNERYRTRGR